MDAVEEDYQRLISLHKADRDKLLKEKPDLYKERDKWDIWSDKYGLVCKIIHHMETTRKVATKGRIIKPPTLLIGRTITFQDIPYEGTECLVSGVGDVDSDQWGDIEKKIHEMILNRYMILLSNALDGFMFSMENERFNKMKDWDYAMVMNPIKLEVRPDGFYITEYTIIDKSKNGTLTMKCDFILDDRKVREIPVGVEPR